MGVLLNRRRYMGASKQAKTLFEMYNQYFDGTVNSVVDTGLKLWDGTHNRWKIEVVFQRITVLNSNITLFSVRPDVSPYSGIRVRQRISYSFSLTVSDTWKTIENPGNFYIYVNSSYGNAIEKSSSLEYDTLTLIRDGQYLYCDYNGQTATLRITDPLTNNLNLLIGCDYKGANNETQRYYTGTVQKFVIKELPPADEVIMTSTTNPEVLAVCYAQRWCADANYMTKSEAEAVTSIGTAFQSNTAITHFEEFEHFTSVTSIVENAFYDCTSLTSIIFPTSVVSTGIRSFFRCRALVDVNIANASILGTLTFYSCTSLESIDISKVHTLGVGVFCLCSSLSDIGDVSNIVTMDPSTGNGVFQETLLQGDYEFTNFTGTIIPTNLFYHVTGITNASFPKSQYTEVGAEAFNGTSIKSFVIREGCQVLNNHSFTSPLMEYLDIPSTVTTWNGFACYYNSNQKVIVCRAATPPTGLNSTNFAKVPSTCKVYVPNASIAAYEAATGWDNLTGRYVPIEESWYETHRSLCPYDAEIDYIECTGTQYINTNVLVEPISDGYEYSINFINDLSGIRTIAGLWEYRYDNNHLCFSVGGNYGSKFYGFPKNWRGGGYAYAKLGNAGEKVDVSLVNLGDYDGSSMTMKVASPLLNQDIVFDNPYINKAVFPFIIGAIWSGNGEPAEFAHVRIYSFKLMRYNTPIFDGIPVRIGTVGYLYDKVSGQLFGNSGTGDFVLGSDKT